MQEKQGKVVHLPGTPEKQDEIVYLPISSIRPNAWNPNEISEKNLQKLRRDIKRTGRVPPIIVRPAGPGEYEIIDGYHRWKELQAMDYSHAPCIIWEVDETEAKLKTVQLNYLRGSPVPIRMANLIHDLNKTMTLEDLEAALPYDQPELKDSLALLKLPTDIEKVVEERAKKERESEPIFISAIIYKDKKRSLYDFIEQAMLASEATFCEIKVKIECPAGDHDLVLGTMQNLAKMDASREGDLKNENAPIVVRFALFPEQAHVVDAALQQVIRQEGLINNPRGMALEYICADYLAGAGVEVKGDEWQEEERGPEEVPEAEETGVCPVRGNPDTCAAGKKKAGRAPKKGNAAKGRKTVDNRRNRSGSGSKSKNH
jgi:ParB/RepB/Spo0J family partition protein